MSFTILSAEDDPLRPAAIVTEDVPKLPTEIVARLRQYQNVRGAGFLGWSPDDRGILIRTRFGNTPQLHRVYTPGGRREQITFFDEPVSGRFVNQARDGAILLTMSTGGNENNQIHWLDVANYRHTLLTNGKSKFGVGPIRRDGQLMIVSSNERNGRDTDLYLADPRKADSRRLIWQTSGEFWAAADWSHDSRTLLMYRYVSANESYPALLDLASGQKTDIAPPEPGKAAVGPLAFSHDDRYLYLASDSGSEFRRLMRRPTAGGAYEPLTADLDWDVADLAVDSNHGTLAFTLNADGASRLFLLTPAVKGNELFRREIKIPLGILSDLEFSPDGGVLGFTFAAPDAPPEAYSLDLASGGMTRWTFSEMGGLNPQAFIVPERIRCRSFDDREIPAYYYRPRTATATKKAPVLITIHGGPEGQFQPYFSPSVQYYATEMGMAVIAPNVRGSTGYGKTFVALDNGELREDSVKDIGAVLDWIATREELDADRVAVSGGSYGGYMSLASLIHYGERIKAGVDTVGIANFITFLESTAAYRQDLRRVEYGDEREPNMRKFLERISPVNNTDKIRSALLVLHGKNDPRVPVGEAQQIAEKVRKQGRSVWTAVAENEGHGFSKKDNADYIRAVEVMFLREHVGK